MTPPVYWLAGVAVIGLTLRRSLPSARHHVAQMHIVALRRDSALTLLEKRGIARIDRPISSSSPERRLS